jgi:hypothetical protein
MSENILEPITNTISKNETVTFLLNYCNKKLELNISDILKKKDKLKTIIKDECKAKLDIILVENNIVLYDFEHDQIINTISDLMVSKTNQFRLIIVPIACI